MRQTFGELGDMARRQEPNGWTSTMFLVTDVLLMLAFFTYPVQLLICKQSHPILIYRFCDL